MPMTADDSFVAFASAAARSAEPVSPTVMAWLFQIIGIIR
jgi:hypothetical protein